MMLARVSAGQLRERSVSASELPDVREIVSAIRSEGDAAVARFARQFGDPKPRELSRCELQRAYDAIASHEREAIESAAERIQGFARAQRAAISDIRVATSWGEIGHRILPMKRAGSYVPAGRYPLPSSLLMTVIPARVAGVGEIVVCTPRATAQTCAAAHVAGADRVFEIGGAQAIAAMAFGTAMVPRVDLIAGPGNAYVTAAKREVLGACGIDALAGPSEVCIVASERADPSLVALDLLAQAEHDVDARAILIAPSESFVAQVERELASALSRIRGEATARTALARSGVACICSLDDAVEIVNDLAPEHLELQGADVEARADDFTAYGALFIGAASAEVFGDYGAGPNHVLPTGSTARFSSGLSVLTFLTTRTYQRIERDSDALVRSSQVLASIEGLDGHALAATARSNKKSR